MKPAIKLREMYVVFVEREGARRTVTVPGDEAREIVHGAVRLGHVVSCRPMVDGDALILGVKVEALSEGP